MVQSDCEFLIIGYGNTLRSDDGAGQIVAETVATWKLPQVRSLAVHQLTPELAENIANSKTVIFVDAVISSVENPKTIEIEAIASNQQSSRLGHTENPRSLLYLSQTLYGNSPKSYWILIPAINFDFGEEISSFTQQGIIQALKAIDRLFDRTTNNLLSTDHARS